MTNYINKREFLLIRYCLDNAMVNLHADTKKIADSALIKLEDQLKEEPQWKPITHITFIQAETGKR